MRADLAQSGDDDRGKKSNGNLSNCCQTTFVAVHYPVTRLATNNRISLYTQLEDTFFEQNPVELPEFAMIGIFPLKLSNRIGDKETAGIWASDRLLMVGHVSDDKPSSMFYDRHILRKPEAAIELSL